MKTVSIAAAKDGFTELLRGVEEGRPVTVTRRGRPVAVIVAESEYERLRSATAAADFGAWIQAWRTRLPAGFDGISADELARWTAEE